MLGQRLRNQLLVASATRTPADVVSWLCAIQAQDYPAAKWAIGLRLPHCHDADIEQAFNDGLILRTHVLRPTWHFVAPEDIRWLLALSGPRVHAVNNYYYRQLGLDAKTFNKSCAMMHRMLEGGQTLTRAELGTHLKRVKIPADGLKLGYLTMHAELEGVICSGPRRGKQFTYALLDERAPAGKPIDREEALGRLAKRYFASHGPATIKDFSWWSGFAMTEAQRAVESVKPALDSDVVGGLKYWSVAAPARPAQKMPVMLLPNYDEYLIAYKDRGLVVDADRAANIAARANSALANHLIIDG
ncbi:MAG TPA: winged helix DNA-binding domain-containing protein, partial [Vicinamibacterales bacterium]|nr:winged helix DNA-binding domain-containing protein [Vicinamibacterales bacterium]